MQTVKEDDVRFQISSPNQEKRTGSQSFASEGSPEVSDEELEVSVDNFVESGSGNSTQVKVSANQKSSTQRAELTKPNQDTSFPFVNQDIVPSKKGKYIGAGVGFFVGAGAGVAVSLLVNGSQEYLLGLILNNAKDLILNSPVGSVAIIAAASAVVAGLIGFAIGYSIDKCPAKVDNVDLYQDSASTSLLYSRHSSQ